MNGQNLNENNNNIQKIKEKQNNNLQLNYNNNYNKSQNEAKQLLSQEYNNTNMDSLNLNAINEEYDIYIANLRDQLSFIKEERKKTENKYNMIKHRLTKLKNQEKTNKLNFQNIKYRFKKILNNRKETQKKINKNKKAYFSASKHKTVKNNESISNFSGAPKNYNNFNRTYSNFGKKSNNNKNNVDYTMEESSKNKLRLKLIEKLKEDEEEKKKIEDELAQIEKEEFLLLNAFKNDKLGENNLK